MKKELRDKRKNFKMRSSRGKAPIRMAPFLKFFGRDLIYQARGVFEIKINYCA
jgi:ribulose 1,5-bisphosphate carboxylase large subunit-like protein